MGWKGRGVRYQLGRVLAVGAAALPASVLAASAAMASWTPHVAVSPSGWISVWQRTALDRSGDALLMWVALPPGSNVYHVQERTRSRTGVLGPIRTLSTQTDEGIWADAAMSPRGAGVVAWPAANVGPILARQVARSGKPGPLLNMSPGVGDIIQVRTAMLPSGAALVAWEGGQDGVQARFISPTGKLGPLLSLGGAPLGNPPRIAISPAGVVTVAWTGFKGVDAVRLTSPTSPPSRVRNVIPNAARTSYHVQQIADDANGDTVFDVSTVTNLSNGSQVADLVWRAWSHSGRLGPVAKVARNIDVVTSYAAMATDRNGNSILAWSRYVTAHKSLVYRRRVTLGGKLGTPVVMGSGFAPAVTTDSAGSGMIAWQTIPLPQPGSTGGVVGQIYERPVTTTTGTFGTTHRVTADGSTFELAENAAGQHAMIWQQSTPQYPAVASFDP